MDKSNYKELRSQLNFKFRPWHLLLQLSIDVCSLGLILYLTKLPELSLCNVVFIPLFMFRQFSILHEAVHGLSHPNSKINFTIGVISGAFCLTPFVIWKSAHLKHHYWTGNLDKDPTFAILKSYKESSENKKKIIEYSWKIGLPFLGLLQHWGFIIYFFKTFFENKKSSEYWANLMIPILLFFFILPKFSWISLSTTVVGILIYFRLFEDMIIPQHVGLYSDDEPDMHLPPWDQTEITRNWKLSNFIEQHIALNMNYHTEHHLFPDLPWHELKKAHRLIKASSQPYLNEINSDWISNQRQRKFSDVIQPIPARKNKKAA